jgi:hypothetical protein
MYPNPAEGVVNISCNFTGSLSIFDSQGKIVIREHPVRQGVSMIDTGFLSPGLYIVRISENAKSIYTEKLIIE